ncbi:MAG: rhomboid family intramembrane serine protease [Bacteroidia bacterium]
MSFTDDIRTGLKGTYGALIRLILINCIIFLAVNVTIGVLLLSDNGDLASGISSLLNLPAHPDKIPFRFWTIFTYMFVHYDFFHLLSNMLWLWFLGKMFSDFLGGARLNAVYILGGLTGAVFFIAVSNMIPAFRNTTLVGASAGVMAVVVAIATYQPDARVYPFGFSMKLKWLALISFILTTLLDLTSNTGGKAAHLGGALFGMLYGYQIRKNSSFLSGFSGLFSRSKLRVEYSKSKLRNDDVYNMSRAAIRKRVDEILDKISRSGYDSLNKEEKEFLQKNHDKF